MNYVQNFHHAQITNLWSLYNTYTMCFVPDCFLGDSAWGSVVQPFALCFFVQI